MKRTLKRIVRACAVSLLAGAVFLTSDLALARGQKVLVTGFTGAKKQKLRDEVVRALEAAGYETVDDERLTDDSKPKDIAKRAKAKGADAVVTGEGTLKKQGWKLKVTVRSAKDGSVVEETEFAAPLLPKLLTRVSSGAASTLGGPIDRASGGESEPEPEPKAKEEPEEKPKAEEEKEEKAEEPEEDKKPEDDQKDEPKERPGKAKPSPLDLGAGLRVFRRDMRYEQDVNQNLRKYALPLGPAAFVRVTWYPAAHFTSGFASNIGISGAYEQSFAASSELESGGTSYTTTMRAWSAGLRLRLPFASRSHEAGFGIRYGAQSFSVDGDNDPTAVTPTGTPITRDYIPDVSYKYVRPSADLRLGFGAFTVGAGLGLRFVTDAGAVQSTQWFPEASVLAMDAEAFLGYAVAKDLFAVLGGGIQRYGYNMHSKPSDLTQGRDVAGGAIDQYLSLHAGIEWRPGASRPSGDTARAKGVLVGSR